MKIISSFLFIMSFIFLPSTAYTSQWVRTNGPEGGSMEGMAFDASNNLVYSYGRGGRIFFQSNTVGSTWSASEFINLPGNIISDLVIDNADSDILYTINSGQIYQGSKTGTWSVKTITVGSEVFATHLYQSNTTATTWFAFHEGNSRLFTSTDNMVSWSEMTLPSDTFTILYQTSSDELWLGGYSSSQNPILYYLNNYAGSWVQKGNVEINQANARIKSIIVEAGNQYVGLADLDNEPFDVANDNYFYHSSTNGANYTRIALPNSDAEINVTSADNNQVNVVSGSLVFRSTNTGLTWSDISPPNRRAGDGNVYISPWDANALYLSARARGGILASIDSGTTWSLNNNGLFNTSPSLVSTSKDTNKPNRLISSNAMGEGVFISYNAGISWQDTTDNGVEHPWVDEIAISPHDPDLIWEIADTGNIGVSTDGGQNWSEKLDAQGTGFRYGSIYALASAPSARATLYALKNGFGIYKSDNSGDQWQYLNDSQVDYSYSLSVHPANADILISGYNPKPSETFAKLMRSDDGGQNWTKVKQYAGASGATSVQFAANGTQLFAGVTNATGGEVWKSSDIGVSWSATQTSFNFINVRHVVQDPSSASHLFALLWGGGVYQSNDSGSTWEKLTGLESWSDSISALAIDPTNATNLYAGDRLSNKIFKSTDTGTTWTEYTAITGQNRIATLAVSSNGANLYAAALGFMGPFSGDIVRIDLSDASQTNISAGFDGVPLSMTALDADKLIAAGHGRYVYSSNDQGNNWTQLSVTPSDDENFGFFRIVKDPSDINTVYLVGGDDRAENFTRNNVASSTMHSLWKTIDGGSTWANLNLNQGASLRDLAISSDGQTLVSVGMNNQIRISENAGATWVTATMPFSMAASVKLTGSKAITVGMLGGGVWTATWTTLPTLSWSAQNQLDAPIQNIQLVTHPVDAAVAYATGYPGGVYRTSDGGTTWIELNDGLPTVSVDDPNRQGYYRLAIDKADGNRLLLGLYGKGLFMTDTVNDIIWRPTYGASNELSGIKLTDILMDNSRWWLASENGIWLSTDSGANWNRDDTNIPVPDIRTLTLGENSQLIAGTRGYELFINDTDTGWRQLNGFGNFGVRWGQWNRNLYQYSTLLFDRNDANNIYIGSFPSGIYKSTDKGTTWREHNVGWLNDGVFSLIQPLASDPNVIMAGTYNGINISLNGGLNWQPSDNGMPSEQWVFSIALDPFDATGNTLYAATKNGLNLGVGDTGADIYGTVMKSVDGGNNWTEITNGLTKDQEFYRIIADPNPGMQGTLYLATQYNGVWITQDAGANWAAWNTGFFSETWAATNGDNIAATMDISVDGQYLYFGSSGMGIWRRPTFSHTDATVVASDITDVDFFRISTTNAATIEQTIQLSAVGDLDFTVTNLSLTGDGSSFTIDTSDCGATLTALEKCDIVISIAATAPGVYTAQLSAAEIADPVDITTTINAPPVANDQPVTLTEDTVANIIADASNTDSDALILTITAATQSGSIEVNLAGDGFTYLPDANYSGADSFTYSATDGLEADSAVVTLTVSPENDLPNLTKNQFTAVTGTEKTFNLVATDVDLDNVVFSLVNVTTGASATIASDGKLTFNSSSSGNYNITVSMNDGTTAVESTVTVTVNDVSAPTQPETETTPPKKGGSLPGSLLVIGILLSLTRKNSSIK